MALEKKKIIIKVYDNNDNYLATWNDQTKPIEYSWAINGGLSNLSLQLARTVDDFGEGDDVDFFNRVKIILSDKDDKDLTLYDGYIVDYRPFKGAQEEYIDIELYSYLSETADKILKDANDKTTLNYLSQNPADILKSILKNLKRDGGKLYYTDSTIDSVGTTVSYEFKFLTYNEAISKLIELCPYNWYWYAGRDNNIYLKYADLNTIDHTLRLGREVKSLSPWKKGSSVYNVVYFLGDGIYKKYERATAISDYGRLEYKMSDDRVSVEATANAMASRFLDEYDHPELTFDIEVVDNNGVEAQGYDIESLKPGDVVRVQDPNITSSPTLWDVGLWDRDKWDALLAFSLATPMTIRNIRYGEEVATITCSTRFPEVSKRIEDINRNLEKKIAENITDTPT